MNTLLIYLKTFLLFLVLINATYAEFRLGARSHGAFISEKYDVVQGSKFNSAFLATGFIHWAGKIFKYHYFFLGPYVGSGRIFPRSAFINTSMLRFGVDLGFEYRIFKSNFWFTRIMVGQEKYTITNDSAKRSINSVGLNFSGALGLGLKLKTRTTIRLWAEFLFFSSNAKITETQELAADIEARRNLFGYGIGAGVSLAAF